MCSRTQSRREAHWDRPDLDRVPDRTNPRSPSSRPGGPRTLLRRVYNDRRPLVRDERGPLGPNPLKRESDPWSEDGPPGRDPHLFFTENFGPQTRRVVKSPTVPPPTRRYSGSPFRYHPYTVPRRSKGLRRLGENVNERCSGPRRRPPRKWARGRGWSPYLPFKGKPRPTLRR